MIRRIEKCSICRRPLFRWRTKNGIEGLSGWKCINCRGILSIDQYPHDLPTKELRRRIIREERIIDPTKITSLEWVKFEENHKPKNINTLKG